MVKIKKGKDENRKGSCDSVDFGHEDRVFKEKRILFQEEEGKVLGFSFLEFLLIFLDLLVFLFNFFGLLFWLP